MRFRRSDPRPLGEGKYRWLKLPRVSTTWTEPGTLWVPGSYLIVC